MNVQRARIGPLTFEARRFPIPSCTVSHVSEGFVLRTHAWTRKEAKRRAGMVMVQYGYWPPWLSVPEGLLDRELR